MERKKEITGLFLLIVIIGLFYSKVLSGFFVQDEWYGFGWFLLHKDLNLLELLRFFFAPDIGHYNPLTNIVTSLFFFHWGINYTKFAIIGILMHVFVSMAVYFLAKIVFKGNRILAFFVALIFGLFASPYQGVAWVVTNIATLSSSFLGVVSAIIFFTFLNVRKRRFLVWSLLFLLVSLLFKEITIGLFPLFFVLCLIRTSGQVKRKSAFLIIFFAAGYILFRVAMFFTPHQTGSLLFSQPPSARIVIYNFITLPIKSLAQTVVSPEFMKMTSLSLARIFPTSISGIPGSPVFEAFAVEKIMEIVTLVVGLALIFVGLFIVRKSRRNDFKDSVLLGLGWIIINSFIFSISPGVSRPIFIVDSRNLYFTSVGIAIFLAGFLKLLTGEKTKTFLILALAILILNIYWLNFNISSFVKVGIIRKNILEKIVMSYPRLPPKAVIYAMSDISYYGLPENERILPFQSGFGQTLLVFYNQSEEFPNDFFPGNYLWDIESQGYEEHGLRGFGYFRDLELLKKTLNEYNIPKESVIAFSWSSSTNQLTDITLEVRSKLTQ
ncbi:hypothetical protein COU95_02125 [Candidatus Shapirobacteria bacterium CG10_big_fil_rev_8_21_14_0_10_40_9]|uniref:Glycosyltransferase RgtA/B/C/D-like domain-containing protein n=1 Tax=Candidatus Shapirobacteria bacterium CG10_big_fil_rev_8_21_14_0_10_40_9 TaxID=1974888 RepID=A0A2M8L3K1_9BACT|nr:MAG: hypothetical protein COU95_02125 [Candidatus Shapirobacteria bacterium CG10_big_fil_rev_8_21_14_0_10_40_9]